MPTFETPDPIEAVVEIGVGEVRIAAGDRTTTVVDVQPRDASDAEDVKVARATRVEYVSGRLQVKAPRHGLRSWLPWNDGGALTVTVELPAGSRVTGSCAMGEIRCEGELGACRLDTGMGGIRVERTGALEVKSGMGDIVVDRTGGPATIATGSGEVRLGEVDGTATIKSANGDLWMGRVDGDVRISAANGSITVERAGASVVAKSAYGDVRVGDVARGSVVLTTAAGNLEVGIREGTAAWLDLHTSTGAVRNRLAQTGDPGPADDRVTVRARTAMGDITVGRP